MNGSEGCRTLGNGLGDSGRTEKDQFSGDRNGNSMISGDQSPVQCSVQSWTLQP